MTWNITMLFFNAALLLMLCQLWKDAPDRFQRVAVLLLVIAATILLIGDFAAVSGLWWHWSVTRLAREIEHVAVIVVVARLFVVQQEKRCLQSYSIHSRN